MLLLKWFYTLSLVDVLSQFCCGGLQRVFWLSCPVFVIAGNVDCEMLYKQLCAFLNGFQMENAKVKACFDADDVFLW